MVTMSSGNENEVPPRPQLDEKVDGEKNISETKTTSSATLDDTQYPQGLKFVLLAGASIIAVFLIALDQVRKHR